MFFFSLKKLYINNYKASSGLFFFGGSKNKAETPLSLSLFFCLYSVKFIYLFIYLLKKQKFLISKKNTLKRYETLFNMEEQPFFFLLSGFTFTISWVFRPQRISFFLYINK